MLQNTVPKIIFDKGVRLKILSHVTILADPWQESHRPLWHLRDDSGQVKLGGFHTDDFSFSFYVPILSTKDDHFFHANRNIDKAVATAVDLERFSNW